MTPLAPDTLLRQRWLRTLAQADRAALERLAAPMLADFDFEDLRAPETGLVLLRARIGGEGGRFNLGEATVTRCVLRHTAPDGRRLGGVGTVLGRDVDRARRIAALDALLQRDDLRADLERAVLAPLAAATEARHARDRAEAEATRVRFYTLQPEQTG